MSNTKSEPGQTFEKALERLQLNVRALESGQLSLEEALKSFEEGVSLTRFCQKTLDDAEKRVEILTRPTGSGVPETAPFEAESSD